MRGWCFTRDRLWPLLVAAVLVVVAGPVLGAEKVGIETGLHDGFGRIVFAWPEPIKFVATIGEQGLTIKFERPLDADLALIAKLQEMEGTINDAFKKEDQKDDAKLKSLVKIYETMKPKEAARIFEQLDLPVLLDVLERMKETKTSPILASMEPGKAKAVTLALAARHPAPELKQ